MLFFQYVPIAVEEYLRPMVAAEYNPDLPIDEQTDCLAYDAKWEYPKQQLKFGMW